MKCKAISVSVDLDTLEYYANFRSGAAAASSCPSISRYLESMLDLFDELGVKATIFTIGETIETQRDFLRRAVASGHEIASHSQTHVQAFHLLPVERKRSEIRDSKARLEDAASHEVVGFRAPGYNVDGEALNLLAEEGFGYDSSFFPGWFLPAAKLLTRVLSRSYSFFPTTAFHRRNRRLPSAPFRLETEGGSLLEIPIPSTRFGKPFFGTFHLNFSEKFFESEVAWLGENVSVIPYELHPIELLDGDVVKDNQWIGAIPGVGKKKDPLGFLRFRLERLLRVAPAIKMCEIVNDEMSSVHTCL